MEPPDHPSHWKYASPEEEGFYEIVSPGNSACKITWIFRLNLSGNSGYALQDDELELNGVVIKGSVLARFGRDGTTGNTGSDGSNGGIDSTASTDNNSIHLDKLDSFYLPAGDRLIVTAREESSLFIGGSLSQNKSRFFTRKFDLSLPLGDIHQVHGKPPYKREVFMTLAQQDEASRLICGITLGDPGKWTSWPPHQHTDDLEEVYCYFDIPRPRSAFHFCSRKAGEFEYVHPVSSGDCVIIPQGYHPTCGMPGVRSCYFWVMAAHRPERRRYDLALNDPNFG